MLATEYTTRLGKDSDIAFVTHSQGDLIYRAVFISSIRRNSEEVVLRSIRRPRSGCPLQVIERITEISGTQRVLRSADAPPLVIGGLDRVPFAVEMMP